MGFSLDRTKVIEVAVDGRAHSQAFVNIFQFKAQNISGGSAGSDSQALLVSFRTWYRANFLAASYLTFGASFYWLRQITSAASIPGVAPNGPSYIPVYGPMQDVLAGGTINDAGALAPGTDYLPTFVAMNVRRITQVLGRRYWRSSIRVGPFVEADQGTTVQFFNAGATTRWDTALNSLALVPLSDGGGAGNGWLNAVFSAAYHFKVNLPLAVSVNDSAQYVTSYLSNQVVTTQRSRKMKSGSGV